MVYIAYLYGNTIQLTATGPAVRSLDTGRANTPPSTFIQCVNGFFSVEMPLMCLFFGGKVADKDGFPILIF